MPAKMQMIISNGGFRTMNMKTFTPATSTNLAKPPMIISNRGFRTMKTFTQTTSTNLAKTSTIVSEPVELNSAMITRIHNIKPGCGSCGR